MVDFAGFGNRVKPLCQAPLRGMLPAC